MWADYWNVRFDAGTPSAGNFKSRAKSVSTGMEYNGLLKIDSEFRKEKVAYFGERVSRLSWGPLSNDGAAVIRDCMDQSKFGTFDTTNNKAITIGGSRVNLNVTFQKVDGQWRVFAIYEPKGESC